MQHKDYLGLVKIVFHIILYHLSHSYKSYLRGDSNLCLTFPKPCVLLGPWLWILTHFCFCCCLHSLEDTVSFPSIYWHHPGRYFFLHSVHKYSFYVPAQRYLKNQSLFINFIINSICLSLDLLKHNIFLKETTAFLKV